MRELLTALALASCTAAAAQDEWSLTNGRPDFEEQVTIDDTGVHRIRRAGRVNASMPAEGSPHIPVVLVAFADLAFSCDSTDEAVNDYYDLYCNGTMDGNRYTGHGSYGAVRDFFAEQSDSVFLPQFTIIGPVTLDNGYAYYGANTSQRDPNYNTFRNEALRKATAAYSGEWSDFDNDGNGTVDLIIFVYAGMGEHNGGSTDHLWAKESTTAVTVDDVTFSTTAATSECRYATRDDDGNVLTTKPDGVGTFLHEFSHALGLPDFYDTNGVAFGMDTWSLMDYGNYVGNGYYPCAYTAYERDYLGWRQIVDVDEPAVLTLSTFTDGGVAYRVTNDASSSEYYVLENRQSQGWDAVLCNVGHGMQVTHVDYSASAWTNNSVNSASSHQRMTIISAGNNYEGVNVAATTSQWRTMIASSLYPGTELNYDLTDDSTPAAEVYTGTLMHKPIRNITENEDGTITLCFRTNGQLTAPDGLDTDDTAELWWSSVDNATAYVCELYKGSTLLRTDTVADNGITYDELSNWSTLSARVMAIADTPEDYLPSEWSEMFYFDTTGIIDISMAQLMVSVYTSGGILVTRCPANQLSIASLRRGLYIIRYPNGFGKKIMVE